MLSAEYADGVSFLLWISFMMTPHPPQAVPLPLEGKAWKIKQAAQQHVLRFPLHDR